MGIDAEMLIRYSGEKPSEAQLLRWSWDLCRSVGAKHFFISVGLPRKNYAAATERPNNGGFFLSAPDEAAKREVHERILASLQPAPKERRLAIDLCRGIEADENYGEVPATHMAEGMCYVQDGEPILARPGEWLMEVSLWTRYYGIGYERGDLLTICAVAEWIEANIASSEVWYGGDSSGVEAEPFPEAKRAALRRHLYGTSGRDYFAYSGDKLREHPKPCGLCVPGEPRFNSFGGGQGVTFVSCAGCGKSFEGCGDVWTERKEKD